MAAEKRARSRLKRRENDPPVSLARAEPNRSIWLEFDATAVGDPERLEKLRGNLSAIEFDGSSFWVAGDEDALIEKLSPAGNGTYANHRRFALGHPFALLQGDAGEIDIEGLSRDGNRLWITGSHCRTRRKPPEGAPESDDDALAAFQLMKVRARSKHLDRHLLGCLDLSQEPVEPGAPFRRKAAAFVPFTDDGSELTEALRDDVHLRRFFSLPSKENGFDIEGIAVRGAAAFVGLRGPVLGGLAIVLELRVGLDGGAVVLEPFDHEELYLKHALHLDGLGVRDLAFRGTDLLILAAPTMAIDGTARVYQWDIGRRSRIGGIANPERFRELLRLPGGDDGDYAEGMTVLDDRDLAVVFDQPRKHRLQGDSAVRIDVFTLP